MSHVLTTTSVLYTVTWSRQKTLDIRLKKLGAGHGDVASTYNNLGIVHSDLEQIRVFIFIMRWPFIRKSWVLIILMSHVLTTISVLYTVTWSRQKTLDIRLKKLGAGHGDVASTYNNLGIVHSDLEQIRVFIFIMRWPFIRKSWVLIILMSHVLTTISVLYTVTWSRQKTLDIRLKKLGAGHGDVASTYNCLGIVHRHLGELEQAKEYYDRALAIRLKKLDPDHVDVAIVYN